MVLVGTEPIGFCAWNENFSEGEKAKGCGKQTRLSVYFHKGEVGRNIEFFLGLKLFAVFFSDFLFTLDDPLEKIHPDG